MAAREFEGDERAHAVPEEGERLVGVWPNLGGEALDD
jgi:hypothetical protein